jgi:hypothetical protein
MPLYARGMRLGGRGKDPQQGPRGKLGNSKVTKLQVYNQSGSGIGSNPAVAWLFDVEAHDNIGPRMRRAHVDVARQVARANGFNCVLIRKEAHDRPTTMARGSPRRGPPVARAALPFPPICT